MNRIVYVLLGLFILPSLAKSETVTAFGVLDGNSRGQVVTKKLTSQSVSRLSDLDTETGEHTNSQYFTSRSTGNFTAMDRDEAGTLYVIQEPNRLLTLDETTGVATDVVTVMDGMFPSPFPLKIPAIAFGPSLIAKGAPTVETGAQEVLYAIIKREGGVVILPGKGAAPSSADNGFILVTIDLVTGVTQDTGIYIGGQEDGRGHGLIYDPDLDRLIHGYFAGTLDIATSEGTTVEVINPYTGEVQVAAHGLMTVSKDGKEVLDDYTMGSFSGMASFGNGVFLAYDNRDSQQLFIFQLIENDDMEAFGNGAVGKGATIVEDYYYDFDVAGDISPYYGRIRAMALTSDGYNLLTETNGDLIIYDKDGNVAPAPPIPTSVGGYPLYLSSIVTQPKTGTIYGLSNADFRMAALNEEIQGGMPTDPEGEAGLYKLDRSGPMEQELSELDVVFFTNSDSNPPKAKNSEKGSEVNIYAIVAITFDELGNLYGYDADFQQLVRIDLATGEVNALTGFIDVPGENVQLEYNPDDGLFYLLSYGGANVAFGQGQLTLTTVAVDGTGNKKTPLSGDIPDMAADSLVYAGAGKFFFTMPLMGYDANVKPLMSDKAGAMFPGEDLVLCVDTLGNVEVVSAPLPQTKIVVGSTFTTTGLSKPGLPPTADVSVGQKRSRLKGNNIYNSGGVGQKASFTKRVRRLKATFFAKVQNDGSSPGTFEVRGSRVGRRDSIRYMIGGRNQTAGMLRGFDKAFAGGDTASIKVSILRRGGRRWTNSTRISASYGRAKDLGKVRAKLISAQRN